MLAERLAAWVLVVGPAAGCPAAHPGDVTRSSFHDGGKLAGSTPGPSHNLENVDTMSGSDPKSLASTASIQLQYGSEFIAVTLEDGQRMREALVAFLEKNTIEGEEYRLQLLQYARRGSVFIGPDNDLRFGGWLLTNYNGALVLMNRDRTLQPFGAFMAELTRVPAPELWAVSRFYFMHIRPR